MRLGVALGWHSLAWEDLQDLTRRAEALGYDAADPRHLLLALLTWEGGATHYGLYRQGKPPRKVQEAVMLSLRARARRERTTLPLDRAHVQPILQHIFELAGEAAGRARAGRIAEAHLLRAFLAVVTTAAAASLLFASAVAFVRWTTPRPEMVDLHAFAQLNEAGNPPGLIGWGAGRGFPRKHEKAAAAVLTVYTP